MFTPPISDEAATGAQSCQRSPQRRREPKGRAQREREPDGWSEDARGHCAYDSRHRRGQPPVRPSGAIRFSTVQVMSPTWIWMQIAIVVFVLIGMVIAIVEARLSAPASACSDRALASSPTALSGNRRRRARIAAGTSAVSHSRQLAQAGLLELLARCPGHGASRSCASEATLWTSPSSHQLQREAAHRRRRSAPPATRP